MILGGNIMAKYDALDVVLRKIESEEDWRNLATICGIETINGDDIERLIEISNISYINELLVKKFNQEIRTNYGNTFANIFRDEYEPDYDDILKATAKKLKIKYIPDMSSLSISDVEYLEKEILTAVLESIKKSIIEKEGIEAWQKIERMTQDGIEKAFKDGKITADEYNEFKISLGNLGLIVAIVAGRMSGFLVYMLANQLFFAISRYLGLGIGVAVAGPIIGRTLSLFLGPVGWILSGLWILYDLGGTNWQKTIPAVVCIGAFRQQQKYKARLL